jgi:hypothetical protein
MVGKKVSCSDFTLNYKGPQIARFDNHKVPPPLGNLIPTAGGRYFFAGENFGTGRVPDITDIDAELSVSLGAGSIIGGCKVCESKQLCNIVAKPPAPLEFVLVASSSKSLPVEYVNSTHLLVMIPPGVGKDLEFVVQVGGQSCLSRGSALCSDKLTLDYNSPIVTGIEPRALRTDGSTIVTLTGVHFGCCNNDCETTCDMAEVRRGLNEEDVRTQNAESFLPHAPRVVLNGAECELLEFSNTHIVCNAPEGQGTDVGIVVSVGGQNYGPTLVLGVSYLAPTIVAFSPHHGPTAGNVTVVVHGENFGRGGVVHFVMSSVDPLSGVDVNYDGSNVALASDEGQYNEYNNTAELASYVIEGPDSIRSWNHTTIVFRLPEGQVIRILILILILVLMLILIGCTQKLRGACGKIGGHPRLC